MRVGWLADDSPYIGGAELTQAEFKSAAPESVEIVDCPPGGVVPGLDRYVIHNCVTYSREDMRNLSGQPRVKYLHDVWPHGDPEVKRLLVGTAKLVFCSPLQRERLNFVNGGPAIPPPVDLARFRKAGDWPDGDPRVGACWLGHFQNAGKGAHLAAEWAEGNEPLDLYGDGPYAPPESGYVRLCGPVPYEQAPDVLSRYRKFVFLPTALEPFGRAVVEAWAAGCDLVLNRNVGARYWIEENPAALETAAEDFWSVVCG